MSLSLREMRQWPEEIAALAQAARDAAANHTKSADFYRQLVGASTWGGRGGQAAHAGMMSTAGDHEVSAQNLTSAAGGMDRAGTEAAGIVDKIGSILRDADAYPAVHVDEDTNAVNAPDTSHMDKDMKATVVAKVVDLQQRIAAVEASGELVDADLGKAIGTATGTSGQSATLPAGALSAMPGVQNAADGKPGMSDAMKNTLFAGAGDKPAAQTTPADHMPGALSDTLDRVHQPDVKTGDPKPSGAPLDPNSSVGKAQLDTLRNYLQSKGMPADQIEAGIKSLQTPGKPGEPPVWGVGKDRTSTPGLADGAEAHFKAMGEHLLDITGLNGPDKQLDALSNTAEGLRQQALDAATPGGIERRATQDGVKEFIDDIHHPDQIANKTGQHLADLAAVGATLPLGGEGAALGRLGEEGALADATRAGADSTHSGIPGLSHLPGLHDLPGMSDLANTAHDLHTTPPTPIHHPTPAAIAEHPSPSIGDQPIPPVDHSTPPSGDHISTEGELLSHDASGTGGWLHPEMHDQILATDKGFRPDPSQYLSPEYIKDHLAKFDDGATRFMPDVNLDKYGIAQRDGTSFVMPRNEADALLSSVAGDPRAMERALGLPDGFLDSNKIVRIDVPGPGAYELRIPSGNEAGANDQWIPGGKLPDGSSEAIINGGNVPRESYSVTPIPNQRGGR